MCSSDLPARPVQKINPHRLGKVEARVAELEQALSALEAELAEPAIYADGARVVDIGQKQASLRAQLDEAEGELLTLYG